MKPRRSRIRLAKAVFFDPTRHKSITIILVSGEQCVVKSALFSTGCSFSLALFTLLTFEAGLDFTLDMQL